MSNEPVTVDDRILLTFTYVALAVAGAMVGLWAAFLVPLRLPFGVEGLSDVIAFAAPIGLGILATYGVRSTIAALVPGLALIVVTLVASGNGPGGDLIVPGYLQSDPGVGRVGTVLIFAAIFGTAIAVVVASRRIRRTAISSAGSEPPSL